MTCRTIAVANQKGGTAKTATALSLGVALARTGSRVLLVDADPQGDLTKSLGWRDPDSLETTLATHLSAAIAGSDDDPAAGMLRHREGVDLMPSNIELAAMEMAVFMAMSRERMMSAWLAPIKAGYDYVAVDDARPEVLQTHPVEAPEAVFVHRRFEHLDVARRGRVPRVLQSLGHPVRVARGYGLPDEGVADIGGTGQEDARAEHDAVAMALERREVGHNAHDLASDLLVRRP